MRLIEVQGFQVPALGLGTWQLTGRDCKDAVGHALAAGYRHIDTAQMYGNEAEVGEALDAASVPRDDVWVTTKLNVGNLTPDAVAASTEESLAKLRTDYVDLLLIHWPDTDVPLEDTLGAMHALREAGKIRAVGVSNFPPSWVQAAAKAGPVLTNQVEYHPYLSQDALIELMAEHDGFLTAYSPLARGKLLDDPVITDIAETHGAQPAQVVIAWALAQDRVATIPKATAPERIESNLAAAELTLTGDEVARISGLDRGAAGRLIDPPFGPDWER
jgi:2,5-diketo-D-gluconate reductase B